ncbi:MAG: cyclase family protein [Bacteroidota bacterium]
MSCNVGTYLDSPFHRHRDAADLSQVPLQMVAGLVGVILDAPGSAACRISLDRSDVDFRGKAVLIRTGWDQRWRRDRYWEPGPYLRDEAIDFLVDSKPTLVGVDF